MAKKKQKEFGNCRVCEKKLGEYHLSLGAIKVCSFECQDRFNNEDEPYQRPLEPCSPSSEDKALKEPQKDLQKLLIKRFLDGEYEVDLLTSYHIEFAEDDLSIMLSYDRFDGNWHYVREPKECEKDDPRVRAISECAWLFANGEVEYSAELNKEISIMLAS